MVPRTAAWYFGLGDVDDEVRHNVESYYRLGGTEFVELMQSVVLQTPEQITETLTMLEDLGAEEVCLWPQARGPEQLEALADIVF